MKISFGYEIHLFLYDGEPYFACTKLYINFRRFLLTPRPIGLENDLKTSTLFLFSQFLFLLTFGVHTGLWLHVPCRGHNDFVDTTGDVAERGCFKESWRYSVQRLADPFTHVCDGDELQCGLLTEIKSN